MRIAKRDRLWNKNLNYFRSFEIQIFVNFLIVRILLLSPLSNKPQPHTKLHWNIAKIIQIHFQFIHNNFFLYSVRKRNRKIFPFRKMKDKKSTKFQAS